MHSLRDLVICLTVDRFDRREWPVPVGPSFLRWGETHVLKPLEGSIRGMKHLRNCELMLPASFYNHWRIKERGEPLEYGWGCKEEPEKLWRPRGGGNEVQGALKGYWIGLGKVDIHLTAPCL